MNEYEKISNEPSDKVYSHQQKYLISKEELIKLTGLTDEQIDGFPDQILNDGPIISHHEASGVKIYVDLNYGDLIFWLSGYAENGSDVA